ncbi:protein-L-isoaspartate(D-aspartate) O-methyltransferase [bacterium]|nr:protein-L-isoaspartate(D-aspartate) O-methyltransferase [bacterium]
MRFEDQRETLLSELHEMGIRDELVFSAFRSIQREDFVLSHVREFAYRNQALPIEEGQTISQPYIIALMMQELELEPNDVVLEIGTGSGYQTSLLATIVSTVCTIERHFSLTEKAKQTIAKYSFKNIFYKVGDGTKGWINSYPPVKEFNKIIVCAGAPSVSEALLNQLKIGGKLVIPVGNREQQRLKIIIKTETGFSEKQSVACSFVPLLGELGWEKS